MCWKVIVALTIGLQAGACARPGPGVTGSDIGGIIPWSPVNHQLAPDLAAQHCGRYAKYARITSVRAQYGDYIAFACSWR
jgi:hypothetical protein